MKESAPPSGTVGLRFVGGTLELRGLPMEPGALAVLELKWDKRTGCHRAPAFRYAELVRELVQQGFTLEDQARAYDTLTLSDWGHRQPRDYQLEAVRAWLGNKGRGIVVLPTGSGKSHVALMAMKDRGRSTLVVAPTLDLVRQWYELLRTTFDVEIGVVGGGEYVVRPLTVTTYDSAHLHQENFGAKFGMVVFDEVHHLPSPCYQLAAKFSLAPYRLGLTATPDRADGADDELARLVGPIVYQRDITELEGQYLAEYDTERLVVELSPTERTEYDEARAIYLGFVRHHGIRMGGPGGWNDFVRLAARSREGRRAFEAYQRQRTLSVAAGAKLELLEALLVRHRTDRSLVFTLDNATAYAISRRFLVPAITHHTKVRERSRYLQGFSSGAYGVVVTSRVLNEGVDVPDANVAIVVSGTGSVREHVQRLGRILRPRDGKRAILYEIVSGGTGEQSTSERRREHVAYRSRSC